MSVGVLALDRTLHLLAVVGGDRLARRIEPMLRAVGATHVLTSRVGAEHITFANRLADVVILAGVDDALAVLAYLRLAGVELPVVVFRSGGAGGDAALLAGGAAACAPLPRSANELQRVVTAALDGDRRVAGAHHELALDALGLTVQWRGRTARLTRRQFALLQCLVARAGQPVSIARLQAHAWAEMLPRQSASQIVTVYVHQIRRKLRELRLEDAVVTVRNFGYAFVPPAPQEEPPTPGKRVRRGAARPSSPPRHRSRRGRTR